jgi:protein-arginine kinase activator protein McsA
MPKYTKEELIEVVKNSSTIKEVLSALELRTAGGNYKVFRHYCDLWKIDTSHFLTATDVAKKNWNVNKFNKTKIDDILVQNSTFNRTHLKERLYAEGLKQRKCELCGQDEIWKGKKMSLILDHINGVWNDNRIQNLRIVCPNCNSTLPTHAGKNFKKIKVLKPRKYKEKIEWPPVEQLITMVEASSYVAVAKKLNVSDNAVRKRIKTRSL